VTLPPIYDLQRWAAWTSRIRRWDRWLTIALVTLISLATVPESEPECSDHVGYFESGAYYRNGDSCSGPSSPIIIPLLAEKNGNKPDEYQLTSRGSGVIFDLNNDGTAEQTAWTAPGSRLAFLAIDRDGDGAITNGSELFGNYTLPGVRDGFAALDHIEPQAPDAPRSHIDEGDSLYAKLLLWEDRNHNGISEKNELSKFSERYTRIGTGYGGPTKERDKFGNLFLYQGWVEVRTAPGSNRPVDGSEHFERTRQVFDVFFNTRQ
jgi:hypothetical protein